MTGKRVLMVAASAVFLLAAPALAQPVIDGIIGAGEWDAYFLGTHVTAWSGGMAVEVWGFADDTQVWAAYRADIGQPGWPVACLLSVSANMYYKTPTTASWPDPGYTILEMVFPHVMQTDGAGWVPLVPDDLPSNGIEFAYVDMFATTEPDCVSGAGNNHVAEFKIPRALVGYAGDNGEVLLSGQYWQYDFPNESFFITLPAPDSDGDGVPDDVDCRPMDPWVTCECSDLQGLAGAIRGFPVLGNYLSGSYRVIMGYLADAAKRNCDLDDYRDVVTLLGRLRERCDGTLPPFDWMVTGSAGQSEVFGRVDAMLAAYLEILFPPI